MRKPNIFISFKNAFFGLYQILKTERNFQIEVLALLMNVALIFILGLNTLDAVLILFVCFNVLAAEIFNTAIEKICDFIHPDYDKRIGFIKDITAAAVVILTLLAIIIGLMIYPKYLL